MNQEKEFHTVAQALIFRGKVSLHLVIQQNLLPFLWQAGVLGGITFDVLMTSLLSRRIRQSLRCSAEKPSFWSGKFRERGKSLKDKKDKTENSLLFIPLQPSGAKDVTNCAKRWAI